MKPSHFLLSLALVLFMDVSLADTDDLNALVSGHMACLNALHQTHVRYFLDSQGSNQSYPDNSVHFSRSELDAVVAMGGEANKLFLIQFIVSHEMAHQLQFLTYGTRPPADVLIRRLYECQADIIAAVDLAETSTLLDAPADSMKKTISVLSQLGVENNVVTDHPSGDERRLAFQYGIMKGLQSNPDRSVGGESLAGLSEGLLKFTHWQKGQPLLAWSLGICKQIIHLDAAASASIAIGTVQRHWNKDPNNNFVSYAVPYTNISKRPISVDLGVQSIAVPRFSSSDISLWQRFDNANYQFNLAPGETHVVTGSLRWFGTRDWMPRLILPPERNSLYSAEFSDGLSEQVEHSGRSDMQLTADNLERVVLRYLNNADKGYEDFIAARLSERYNLGGTQNDIFVASLPFPASLTTEIWRPEGEPSYLRSEIYMGYSKGAALDMFNRYNDLLSERFKRVQTRSDPPSAIIAETAFDPSAKPDEASPGQSSSQSRLSVRVRVNAAQRYTVALTLQTND